jgi:hypothetical protein
MKRRGFLAALLGLVVGPKMAARLMPMRETLLGFPMICSVDWARGVESTVVFEKPRYYARQFKIHTDEGWTDWIDIQAFSRQVDAGFTRETNE